MRKRSSLVEDHLQGGQRYEKKHGSGWDTCTMAVFCIVCLAVNIIVRSILASLLMAAFNLSLLAVGGMHLRRMIWRLLPVLLMGVVILALQALLRGSTPLFTIPIAGHDIVAYREGLKVGILILTRVLAGFSQILLFSQVVPVHEMLQSLRNIGVPAFVIHNALLVYRYIFLVGEEAERIHQAQKVRLGHATWLGRMRSLGAMLGILFIRLHERSSLIFEAFRVRGMPEMVLQRERKRFSWREARQATLLASAVVVFLAVGLVFNVGA